jgi:hypothetical protein
MAKKPAKKAAPAKKAVKKVAKASGAKPAPAKKDAVKKEAPKKAAVKNVAAKKKVVKKVAVKKVADKKSPVEKKKVVKRVRAPKEVRLKAFWGVFNQTMRRVALYEFNERKQADKKAEELTKSGKSPHFVQPVKEQIVDG